MRSSGRPLVQRPPEQIYSIPRIYRLKPPFFKEAKLRWCNVRRISIRVALVYIGQGAGVIVRLVEEEECALLFPG